MSARTRRAETQNLDSLLDTMANVTGILVVLLAVTQISVGNAMERLREQLLARPELSREALAAAEHEAAGLRDALAPRRDEIPALESRRVALRREVSAERATLASLEAELAPTRGEPRSEAEFERRIAAASGRARAAERAIAVEQAAVAALEAQLATSPSAPVARDARLPDSRPPPSGAEAVHYFCRFGRIFRVDGGDLVRRMWDAAHRATGGTSAERLRASQTDRLRVIQYFQTHDVGNADLRWRVYESGPELVGQLEWRRQDIGEDRERVVSGLSSYRAELLQLSRRSHYLRFWVWDDSFEVYLAARELTDEAGIAAGWSPRPAEVPFRQAMTSAGRAHWID